MMYNNIMYCSKCKTTESTFVKYAKIKLKDGDYRQYYYCDPCNTKRARLYRKTNNGKEAVKKAVLKNIENNPERRNAWQKAAYAEYKGLLIKKPCEVCGEIKVHKHHPDPRKPLDVNYLCAYHHKQAHKMSNSIRI